MQHMESEIQKSVLMGEALLFGLLGKALYQNLDKNWLETLIQEEVFVEAPFGAEQAEIKSGLEFLQKWSEENRAGISDTQFEALAKDHLYLFIGPDKVLVPIWESAYFNRGRLIFQEQTIQVREWYARFGLEIESVNHEPDDHIGLELSFVAHLATLGLQVLEDGDEHKFENILQAQRDFLGEHLLCWGPAWARSVGEHAGTDFYRGLAHLTHGALLAAAETLQIKLPREVSI